MGRTDFQLRKVIMRYKYIGYNLNAIGQSAWLVINTNTVEHCAAFFNCTPVDWASDPDLKLFILVGLDRSSFVCCLVHRGSTGDSCGAVWQSTYLQLTRC